MHTDSALRPAAVLAAGLLLMALMAIPRSRPPAPVSSQGAHARDLAPTWTNPVDHQEMVLVPAGEFIMGNDEGDDGERPAHQVFLPAFYIGKTEVTLAQYQRFVAATHYQPAGPWNPPDRDPRCPVTAVNLTDIEAYCRWAGLRLPTEAEWEKAARGTDGRLWPWGNTWDARRSNGGMSDHRDRKPMPVGSCPSGASPFGCLDMAGNAFEWTSSASFNYPYRPDDGRETQNMQTPRVIRGGCWVSSTSYVCRTSYRTAAPPGRPLKIIGFRCVRPVSGP